MPAVDAVKQQDRWESVVEPGDLPGELHARRATTTSQPRLWLVIHVLDHRRSRGRHGTGNIVCRASVGATSVVGDRARVRRFRRVRTVRISGRPAQPGAALAGACGQAASHPRIGGTGGANSRSFRTSIELGEHDGHRKKIALRVGDLGPNRESYVHAGAWQAAFPERSWSRAAAQPEETPQRVMSRLALHSVVNERTLGALQSRQRRRFDS